MRKFLSVALATILFTLSFAIFTEASATSEVAGAGRVSTSSSSLNVRSSPSSNTSIKTTLPRNSYVTLLEQNGDFWHVQYGQNSYGYCHKNYIYQVSSAVRYVKLSSGTLRVRSTPSTSGIIKDNLTSDTPVTVLSVTDGFAKIIYHGNKIGYVSRNYLTSVKPEYTYKSIRLSVPDYKQTDPRWSGVTLGSSGQSIGRIGCATTALAMTESYRTGTVIYPHQMAKKLSYTSGGAVYWPTSYNVSTSQGYLTTIYNALLQGKPVIVGAKKSNGGQHYVVVTGIKSTRSLSAEAFYINDPGSTSRTTLSQFFSAYPYFYKILWAK
ncbi:MAG: SH3 domain-containing protein [Clostridia bacterium]|nr:SH3 domain-containing protein [Clostridia bacterium]